MVSPFPDPVLNESCTVGSFLFCKDESMLSSLFGSLFSISCFLCANVLQMGGEGYFVKEECTVYIYFWHVR